MDSLHSVPVPQSSIFHLFGQQSFLSFHVFMITHPGTAHTETTITIFKKNQQKTHAWLLQRQSSSDFNTYSWCNTLIAQKRQNVRGDVKVTFFLEVLGPSLLGRVNLGPS